MRNKKIRWSVSGGFGILLAVLLFLDSQNLVLWALLACALHEAGHVLAILLLRGQIEAFHLSVVGAEIIPQRARLFSYGEELLIAAAGPLMSVGAALFTAAIAARLHSETAYLFAGLNLAAGVFNLIPAGSLDGGRILRILLNRYTSGLAQEEICRCVTLGFSLSLLLLAVWHMKALGGNLTLLLSSVWLLAGAGGKEAHARLK